MRSLLLAAVGIVIGQWLAFGATASPASLYSLGMAVSEGKDDALNGSRPARFVVDTGSSVTLVSPVIGAEILGDAGAREAVPLQTLSGRTSGVSGRLATAR